MDTNDRAGRENLGVLKIDAPFCDGYGEILFNGLSIPTRGLDAPAVLEIHPGYVVLQVSYESKLSGELVDKLNSISSVPREENNTSQTKVTVSLEESVGSVGSKIISSIENPSSHELNAFLTACITSPLFNNIAHVPQTS